MQQTDGERPPAAETGSLDPDELRLLDRVPGLVDETAHLRQELVDTRLRARLHARARGGRSGDPGLGLAVLSR